MIQDAPHLSQRLLEVVETEVDPNTPIKEILLAHATLLVSATVALRRVAAGDAERMRQEGTTLQEDQQTANLVYKVLYFVLKATEAL